MSIKSNPHGFTKEDFVAVRDVVMTAGALFQRFQPGGLRALADVVRNDLAKSKSLMLSPINRRRGEKLQALFEAAEDFRAAADAYALIMSIADPDEGKPTK